MKRLSAILISITISMAADIHVSKQQLWPERTQGRAKVTLTAYIPEGQTKAAVVVCPGGSYFWLDNKDEGESMGEKLSENGIAAFVLHYRVAGKFNFITDMRWLYNGNRFPRMLEDLQQAIIHVRTNADKYGIDPDKVGAIGFSAGGHLVMMAAESEYYPTQFKNYSHPGPESMPSFVAPIYPVVTMSDNDLVHKRSRRALMGIQGGNKALRDVLSVERHIPEGCCPVFLLNAVDDKVVDYRNSELLDSALTQAKVPHKYIQLPSGGHGFGSHSISHEGTTHDWMSAFIDWLNKL